MNIYLFDLDGTLIDSRDDIAASANAAREAVGLAPRPVEEIYPFIGEGSLRLIERTVGEAHAGLVPEALEAWRVHYDAHLLDQTRLYPGIREALEAMTGLRAVVTNKPGPLARKLVVELGLAELLPVVVGGGDAETRKPEPESVFEALKRLGPEAVRERTVLIGDSGIDVRTARAAGIAFVGVLWGLRPQEELEAEGARYLVGAAEELAVAASRALRSDRSQVEPENPSTIRPAPSRT